MLPSVLEHHEYIHVPSTERCCPATATTCVIPLQLRRAPSPAACSFDSMRGKAYTNDQRYSKGRIESAQLTHREQSGEPARRPGGNLHVEDVADQRHASRCK